MGETPATTIWGTKGLFIKLSDDHRYILEQLKYLIPSTFPGMYFEEHTLGLSIYFGATSAADIKKFFSHFETPESLSKIYSLFTSLTVHNVLLMIDEESLRSSIEQQFGRVIQMEPVIKQQLATKYTCSRNWRVHLDQPEIPDSSPFTRNGYPERMRIRVQDTATVQRCASFVVTFYCRKCDKDGHIEREHFKSNMKVATACNSVAAGGYHSIASADKLKAPRLTLPSASSSTNKGWACNSSVGGADVCAIEKDVVGKCNKRSSPQSSVAARGKLSSASADNREALSPFLVSAIASKSKGLATDSSFGASNMCVAEKDVVGKCGKKSSLSSSVATGRKHNNPSADKSKVFWTSGAITSKGLVSDCAFGAADACGVDKNVVGKCHKRSNSKKVRPLPSYRSPSPGFYIGERTASATAVEEIQNTQKTMPKKKGLGPCNLPRILKPNDKAETSQQLVSQSIEISCAGSRKKTASKRACQKRGDAPDVSGSKTMKRSESKYQDSEMDDNEQCQNIFANMLLNLLPGSNGPRVENLSTSKIPSIPATETSFSETSHGSAETAASTSGKGEYGVIRRGEVVSTSGHDSCSNAKKEGSVRLTLIERYIEEVGQPLSLQELQAFMAHAKKKSNLERVLCYYTAEGGAIVSQLQEVLHLYYRNPDPGTKEDKAFVRALEGLCKRLELLEVKKTLKKEVKQERGVKIETIAIKKEH